MGLRAYKKHEQRFAMMKMKKLVCGSCVMFSLSHDLLLIFIFFLFVSRHFHPFPPETDNDIVRNSIF